MFNSVLHFLVACNKPEELNILFKNPELAQLINTKDSNGSTAVHLAATNNFLYVIEILLQNSASVLFYDNEGMLPVDRAKIYASSHEGECLLNEYHSLKAPDKKIDIEKYRNSPIAAYVLLDTVTEINKKWFELIKKGSVSTLDCFWKSYKTWLDIDAFNSEGETALHIAATYSRHLTIAWLLLEKSNHQIKNSRGETACDIAKAKAYIYSNKEKTPTEILNKLICDPLLSFSQLLSAYLIDINTTDSSEPLEIINLKLLATPPELHRLAQKGFDKKLNTILQRSETYIDSTDDTNHTALHYAVYNRQIKCVKLLLENGAKNLPDDNGTTPLKIAHLIGFKAGFNLIQSHLEKRKASEVKSNNPQIISTLFDDKKKKKSKKKKKKKPAASVVQSDASLLTPTSNLADTPTDKPILDTLIEEQSISEKSTEVLIDNHAPSNSIENLPIANNAYNLFSDKISDIPWKKFDIKHDDFCPLLWEIISAIEKSNSVVYINGGAARALVYRNFFPGKPKKINDIDLVTNMTFLETENLLNQLKLSYVLNGAPPNQTFKILVNNNPLVGPSTSNLPIDISFSTIADSSKPKQNNRSLVERIITGADFSLNSFCLDPIRKRILFKNKALNHLRKSNIRVIGIPEDIFESNPYLILRGLRFKIEYESSLPISVYDAIKEKAFLLQDQKHFNITKILEVLKNLFYSCTYCSDAPVLTIIDILKVFIDFHLANHLPLNQMNLKYIGRHEVIAKIVNNEIFSVIAEGNLQQLQILISQGVALNERDEHGKTPLMLAIFHQRIECLCLLLLAGAKIIEEDLNLIAKQDHSLQLKPL